MVEETKMLLKIIIFLSMWNEISGESCFDPGLAFPGDRDGSCCSVGSTLNFSCIEGYRLVGDEKITCLPGGKWNIPRPRCHPPMRVCHDPPPIANGRIEPFVGIKHGDFYRPFEKIRIVCNRGFLYHGTTNILSCTKNAEWTAEFGECREAFCPRPYIADGSIIELENNNATKFPEKFEITYVCNTGFRLIFDYIRDCRTGKWSGYNPYCEKIVCVDPKVPKNGTRSGSDFNVGSKVVFSCSPGYKLLGSAKRYCLPNGQWSGKLTRCDSGTTHCPDPGIPINGWRIGNDFDEDDTVRFTCEDEFILSGSHERQCSADGAWSGAGTICLEEDDFDDENEVKDTLILALHKLEGYMTEYNKWFLYRLVFYFAFDVSREMREKNFKSNIRFAQAVVKKIGVSEIGNRIGALTFGDGVKIQFFPVNFTTTDEVLEALDKIKYEEAGSWRKTVSQVITEEMMSLSREEFGQINFLIFFLTSGRTDMGKYPAIQGGLLKEAGCEVYCIGMTGDMRRGQLYELASRPLNKHVFILKNHLALDWIAQEISTGKVDFDDENKVKDTLISALDQMKKNITEHNYRNPDRPQMLILYFAFQLTSYTYISYFKSSIRFAQALVKKIGVSSNGTRIGALSFAYTVKINFFPANFTTTEEVLEALGEINDEGGSWEKTVSEVIAEEMLPLSSQRFENTSDVKSVVFFLSIGGIYLNEYSATEGSLLVEAGAEVFVVGLAGHAKKNEFRELASSPLDEHVFFLENSLVFDWLAQDILDDVTDFSQCGLVLKHRRGPRMIGGRNATDPWPWMAALYFKRSGMLQDDDKKLDCGGTVIGRKWILTAEHCLQDREDVINTSHVTVKLGLMHVDINTTLQEYEVERFVLHPNYIFQGNNNHDIALIKLDREIKYTRYVRPICLPPEKLPRDSLLYKPKEKAITIGWGVDEQYGNPNKHLQEINQPLQSRGSCIRNLGEHGVKLDLFTTLMLCAGDGTGEEDTCAGDSGNPLMQSQTNNASEVYWTQIGILSWGIGCAQPNTYAFYTHVQKFVPWINSVLNDDKV